MQSPMAAVALVETAATEEAAAVRWYAVGKALAAARPETQSWKVLPIWAQAGSLESPNKVRILCVPATCAEKVTESVSNIL